MHHVALFLVVLSVALLLPGCPPPGAQPADDAGRAGAPPGGRAP